MSKLRLAIDIILFCMLIYGVVINAQNNNITNLLVIIIAILIVK